MIAFLLSYLTLVASISDNFPEKGDSSKISGV
jgi:hypothetical protein